MAEDRDALLKHNRDSRSRLLASIDGLSEEALTEWSIDGWSTKDHLAHVALWDEIRAAEVARISAGHESAWRLDVEQDASYNAIGYANAQELSLDQVRWELATSRQKLLDAILSATARGLDGSLYGEAGLRSGHELEHAGWIHEWRGKREKR